MMDNSVSLLDMKNGAIKELVDYEVPRVMHNIKDPNTSAKAKRKIVLTLIFVPTEDRENFVLDYDVKTTLAPTTPGRTMFYMPDEETAIEMLPQIPGQTDIGGGVQSAPAQLKIIKFA